MKSTALLFVLGAILSWGAYVPTIHEGQNAIEKNKGALRAFLFIGVAYCLTAVIVPAILIFGMKMEPSVFPAKGMTISTLAGIFGAAGALCVILALKNGGTPATVPPLVFAGAPIVATLIAMVLHKPSTAPSPQFYAGILMAAAGAYLVLRFKPA
jgi:uncharacterized membrane protein